MKPHTNLLKEIMRTAPANVRLFQNDQGNVETVDGRRIKYGLLPGSGDLVGWCTLTVQPEMVGRQIAVFLSVEGKTPNDRVRPQQQNWLEIVRAQGGMAFVARSTEECWSEWRAAISDLSD